MNNHVTRRVLKMIDELTIGVLIVFAIYPLSFWELAHDISGDLRKQSR
jgi:hypothetical protein